MTTSAIQHTLALTLSVTLDAFPVDADFQVCRLTRTADKPLPAAFKGSVQQSTVEGVARTKDVDAFNRGESDLVWVKHAYFLSERFLDTLNKRGYVAASEPVSGDNWFRSDPYTAIALERLSPSQLAIADFGAHLLFDLAGVPLPTGIVYNYIDGGMHNGSYDLDKALTILSNDPRVTFFSDKARREVGIPVIQPIPYYSADDEHNQGLSFVFAPTVEDMQVLWERAKPYGDTHFWSHRHQAVADLDMLGLARGGAVRLKAA